MSRAPDVYFEMTKSVAQYAYFQLGVAGGAIAFAAHQTRDMALLHTPWPIGAAVALWAISFACGCSGLEARSDGLAANAKLLFMEEQTPPQWLATVKTFPEYQQWHRDVEEMSQKPWSRFKWQVRTLYLGALAYVAGHIMLMAWR